MPRAHGDENADCDSFLMAEPLGLGFPCSWRTPHPWGCSPAAPWKPSLPWPPSPPGGDDLLGFPDTRLCLFSESNTSRYDASAQFLMSLSHIYTPDAPLGTGEVVAEKMSCFRFLWRCRRQGRKTLDITS